MDHVVVPLDQVHAHEVGRLAYDVATAIDAPEAVARRAHVTLVSYAGLSPEDAAAALRPVAAAARPFAVRAHGYGLFTGDDPRQLCLHVMVVRTAALDRLHGRVDATLRHAGARLDGLTAPRVWSPHITLLDRELTPERVGRAVELLARRHHRHWTIDIGTLLVTSSGRPELWQGRGLPLGAADTSVPSPR